MRLQDGITVRRCLLAVLVFFFPLMPLLSAQDRPVAQNSSAAFKELQTKAQQGDPEAQLALGKAYDDGNGVAQNDGLAVKWYRAAAEHGNATAQNNLGLLYRAGRGVERSKVEAVSWYKKAAKQKNASAMFNLGTAYYNGDGVPVDDTAAYAWFLAAKDLGSQPAVDAVNRMKADTGSREVDAFVKVGEMYEKGEDLPQSNPDAISWYRRAAAFGGGAVKVKLANLLVEDGPQNYNEVRRLCEDASKLQYPGGPYCLGVIYLRGLGVSQDLGRSAKLFTEAANLGSGEAMLQLGQMYWTGSGLKQDKVSAYEYILLSSALGVREATEKKETYEKEMDPKNVKKGKAKAAEWTMNHHPLVLRKTPTATQQ